MKERVLIWDLPLRLYHWLLAASFAGAFLTAESERWRDVHVVCGWTFAGAIAFRLVWGLVGTRHARFHALVLSPARVLRWARSLLAGRPEPHPGHSPAAALMIPLLLGLGLVVAASGWAAYEDLGGEWLGELHEGAAATIGIVVCGHVLGVIVLSLLQRENLALSLVTGRRRGDPRDAIARPRRAIALLLVLALATLWWPLLARRSGARPDRAFPDGAIAARAAPGERATLDD